MNHQPKLPLTAAPFEPVRSRLEKDDKIVIDGVAHKWEETNEAAQILVNVDTRVTVEIPHRDFESGMHFGTIRVLHNYFSLSSARHRSLVDSSGADLTPDELAIAMFRLSRVETFLDLQRQGKVSRSKRGLTRAVEMIEAIFAEEKDEVKGLRAPRGGQPRKGFEHPSIWQLYEWVRKYEAPDGGLVALANGYPRSGNRRPRLHPFIRRLLARYAARTCRPTKPSNAFMHRQLCRLVRRLNKGRARKGLPVLELPSDRSFDRAVGEIEEFERVAGRDGLDVARKRFAAARGGPEASRPFERVEIDEWHVNLVVLLESTGVLEMMSEGELAEVGRQRVYVTVAMDCATRCILAAHLSLTAPSGKSALGGLRMILVDKTPIAKAAGARTAWPCAGLPEEVVTDHGSGFKSDAFRETAALLGIPHTRSPAGLPFLRGKIERFFRTLDSTLLQFFDGRTFSGIAEKGLYDPSKNAVLTVAELERALIRYICDIYHRTPMGMLGGRSPAQEWNRLIEITGVRPVGDADCLREAFGVNFERKMSNRGIRLFGNWYHSDEQHAMWMADTARKVTVRADEFDLTCISLQRGRGDWIKLQVGGSAAGKALTCDHVVARFEAFLHKELPFIDLGDVDENLEVIDEAFGELIEMARHGRQRAGLYDPEKRIRELENLQWAVRAALVEERNRRLSRGDDIFANTVVKPPVIEEQPATPVDPVSEAAPEAAPGDEAARLEREARRRAAKLNIDVER